MRFWVGLFLFTIIGWRCASNNVTEDKSLAPLFGKAGVQGCFALLDNASGTFTVHNLKRYRDSAFSPGATFDIVQALVGLQTGKIVSDTALVKWNGAPVANPACNQDLNLVTAFRIPCPNWFSQLATAIGKDTMQRWVDSLSYGSKKISRIDSFWFDNSLTIRPDEQMGLVKRLYFDQLPFFKVHQQVVKGLMVVEDKPAYKLAYKASEVVTSKSTTMVYLMGWIIEDKQPYFFVLNYESSQGKNATAVGPPLLKDILAQLEFFKGRR